MKNNVNVKALLIGLSMLGVSITAVVVVVVILATRSDDSDFSETANIDRSVGAKDEESSRSETGLITNTPGTGGEEPPPPEASPPEIDDPPSSAELSDSPGNRRPKGNIPSGGHRSVWLE